MTAAHATAAGMLPPSAMRRLGTAWADISLIAAAMFGLLVGVMMVAGRIPLPGDAGAYWVSRPGEYAISVYGYPPVLSQLLEPLRAADAWQLYTVGIETLCFASLGYLGGRWWPILVLPAVPFLYWLPDAFSGPVASAFMGNIAMPMAAAIALGMRRPGWFAVPLLTKMTPGVGVLWYAFRAEWRRFAVGVGVTGAITLVFFALDPSAWFAFVRFAVANAGTPVFGPPIVGPPLWVRLPLAVVLIAWGARTNRPWIVPVAGGIALVGLYGLGSITVVAIAALPLLRNRHGAERSTIPAAPRPEGFGQLDA